jgi:tetratricopeptide (TPR) repeat protein
VSLLGRLFSRGGVGHYRRGIVLFNRQEYAAAADSFEQAIREISDPGHPYHGLGRFYVAEARAKLGLALYRQGRLDEARGQFVRALDAGYRYPDLHYLLARIFVEHGGLKEAEEHCRAALAINAEYVEAHAWLAIVLWKQGREEDARAELARIAQLGFRLPEGLRLDLGRRLDDATMAQVSAETERRADGVEYAQRALEAYHRGDLESAIRELRSAVESQPTYADLRCKLGILYAEVGRFELAAGQLEAAIAINPKYVEARLQLGWTRLRMDDAAASIPHLEAAAEAQPDYPDVQLFLALAHLRQGQLLQARNAAEHALSRNPVFHRARYVLALVLAAMDEERAAFGQLQRTLEAEPHLLHGRADLARYYLVHGEGAKSESLLDRILEEHPEYPDAHLGKALLLSRAGKREAACAQLEHALELNPRFVRALRVLAELRLEADRPAEAEDALRRAIAVAPEYPDLHFLLGKALEAQAAPPRDTPYAEARGSSERFALTAAHTEAIASYQEAVRLNSGYLEARLALGLALVRGGEAQRAREELGAVLRIDPYHPLARAMADPALVGEL